MSPSATTEMIPLNRLEMENKFFISPGTPDAQQAEIIELTWEQLEGIQGGYSWRRFFRDIASFFRQVAEVIGNVTIDVSTKEVQPQAGLYDCTLGGCHSDYNGGGNGA